jgi:release factor glutamine methyltransferase
MKPINIKSYRQTARKHFPLLLHTDIDRIIAQVTELPLLELFFNNERELTIAECAVMDAFFRRRAEKEPLQYIFGEAAFREVILEVGEGVLIPRPETEMLVDLAMGVLSENGSVCDLGTGSGAIAISIALERPDSKVIAVDISEKALKYALKNKYRYSVENLNILHGNLFSSCHGQKINVITANLPYVSKTLYDNLDCEVRSFEPKDALCSGYDGLDLTRIAAAAAPEFLYSDGAIIFEFSPEQKDAMIVILEENNYSDIKIVNDLSNRARFAIGKI